MVLYEHERLLRSYLEEVIGSMDPWSSGRNGVAKNVYGLDSYGQPVFAKRQGGNVLDDEAEEEQRVTQGTQQAACCLVFGGDGTVLAVSRKDDPTAFGLPGGKVDPGETPERAATRELEEETGLLALSARLVYVRHDASGFTTSTFVCDVAGDLDTDEAGVVRWVRPSALFDGPFGDYNRKLWARLGLPE